MTILGISCLFHDAACALIKDGKIVAAIQEERLSRKKHDASFPLLAIQYCLQYAQRIGEPISYACFYEKPFRTFRRIIENSARYAPWSYRTYLSSLRTWMSEKIWIRKRIADALHIPLSHVIFCDHHLAHAASSFYLSGYDEAVCLTIDGVGESATTSWGIGTPDGICMKEEVHFPHSIGLLYATFTAYLGFEVNDGEWKVMGLASYGTPRYEEQIWKMIHRYADGSFALDMSYFSFPYHPTRPYTEKFIDLFGPPIRPSHAYQLTKTSADIAASIQSVIETLILDITGHIRKHTHLSSLCFSGGVALNAKANYRILTESGFSHVSIHPHPGDAGAAMGAALWAYHQLSGSRPSSSFRPYLGPSWSDAQIAKELSDKHIVHIQADEPLLLKKTVDALENGKTIGWMQEGCEWGPRALGARSILADPRNEILREKLNTSVKFRETFRPFAPSILQDDALDIFDVSSAIITQQPYAYMLATVPIRQAWKKNIPAVTHIDGTTRPHLVSSSSPVRFQALLHVWKKRTGIPLLLNTSCNIAGEPMVTSPRDCLNMFQHSGIDCMVMGNCFLEKK